MGRHYVFRGQASQKFTNPLCLCHAYNLLCRINSLFYHCQHGFGFFSGCSHGNQSSQMFRGLGFLFLCRLCCTLSFIFALEKLVHSQSCTLFQSWPVSFFVFYHMTEKKMSHVSWHISIKQCPVSYSSLCMDKQQISGYMIQWSQCICSIVCLNMDPQEYPSVLHCFPTANAFISCTHELSHIPKQLPVVMCTMCTDG